MNNFGLPCSKKLKFHNFPKILLGIFQYMFCGDAINTVAMVTTISKVAFCIFKITLFQMLMCNAVTVLEVYTNQETLQSLTFKICSKHANNCSKQRIVGNFHFFKISFYCKFFSTYRYVTVQFLL